MLNRKKLQMEIANKLKNTRRISLWKSSLNCERFVKTLNPAQKKLFDELFTLDERDRELRDEQVVQFTLEEIGRMFAPPAIYFD